jgi:hypothetical protein
MASGLAKRSDGPNEESVAKRLDALILPTSLQHSHIGPLAGPLAYSPVTSSYEGLGFDSAAIPLSRLA